MINQKPETTLPAVGETLHRLLHAYKRAMREEYDAADIGLTVSHMRVLKGVAGLPDATAQAIADRMRQDKGRIARLLKDLADHGLIERCPHPQDNRSRQLVLTPAGRAMREHLAQIERRAGARLAADLPAEDLQRFTQLAETMITNLEQPGECR